MVKRKVAIQGIRGSFHDIATHEYFAGEEVALRCCDTFEQVANAVVEGSEELGLMAIENTIAGSILHNYEILLASGARVVGEHKLHIRHSIMCRPDESWEDLTEVNSHPVALAQCRGYLSKKVGLKVVETYDTAGAAERIARRGLKGHAAICHAQAANIYGLKVLEDAIEDNKHNFTRFLVLAPADKAEALSPFQESNKAMIVFTLPHTEGCLSQVLSIFTFYHINLTKIQSLPIIGSEWHYLFYVDVTYDDAVRFAQSLEAVRPLTEKLRVLGAFRQAADIPLQTS